VAAVGNAYGYEHTVTTGIVSHLDRTVQVNDTQIYEHLIQTDAPINPGNSGGPLLNLDGEMIGVNVAVRVGAQGIAFAIPVDKAVQVAADLIDNHTRNTVRHGMTVETRYDGNTPSVVIRSIQPESPAASAGLAVGDVIVSIDGRPVLRAMDFHRSLLEQAPGKQLELTVQRTGKSEAWNTPLVLQSATASASAIAVAANGGNPIAWNSMGLKVVEVDESQMSIRHPDYQRGLRVTEVRSGSPAFVEGIQIGDVLVAMYGLKTESIDNLAYILDRPEIRRRDEFRFYILRQNETFRGQMRIADRSTALQPAISNDRSNR
jgi:serine protease Do